MRASRRSSASLAGLRQVPAARCIPGIRGHDGMMPTVSLSAKSTPDPLRVVTRDATTSDSALRAPLGGQEQLDHVGEQGKEAVDVDGVRVGGDLQAEPIDEGDYH